MSSEFKQFSEAARLYAQYAQIVEQMEEIFVNDISAFLDAVRTRMQAKLDSGRIEEEETKEYRSWWIEDEDTKHNEDPPFIWLERRLSEIIIPGVLTVMADINDADEAEKRRVASIKSSLVLPTNCKLLDRRRFAVSISYGDGDPVETASVPILAILIALHRAEKALLSAQAKRGRRGKLKAKN
jgi:hypothetical protein